MIEYEDQTEDEAVVADDDDDQDDTIYVAMVGDMSHGYRAVGPFESFDIAHEWAEANIGLSELTWIIPLCGPYTPEATKP